MFQLIFKRLTVTTEISYYKGLKEEASLTDEFIESLRNDFSVYYTPFTKIKKVTDKAASVCNCFTNSSEFNAERFLTYGKKQYYSLNYNGNLSRLLKFLGNSDTLHLYFIIGVGGGGTVENIDGIRIFYHTKELRHVPHVHAEYQGQEISIEIISLKVKGKFKNKKKEKQVIDYVKSNQKYLLEQYEQFTNGIKISTSQLVNDEIQPLY